jgi:hypothetical protein
VSVKAPVVEFVTQYWLTVAGTEIVRAPVKRPVNCRLVLAASVDDSV